MTTLKEDLTTLDALLEAKLASVVASLRPPAGKRALARLAKVFGGTVPAELVTWFSWHDGQQASSFVSLIPDTNWSAMPAAEVVGVHAFLSAPNADVKQPWKPSWVPLFENGGGDHLCWDRDTGALLTWYHDDASRPRAYRGFRDLVTQMVKAYRRMKKPTGFPPPAVARWAKVAAKPSVGTLAKFKVGTALGYTAHLTMGRMSEIAVKLADDRWITCSGHSRGAALEEWERFASRPPAESSGYYTDDDGLAYALASYGADVVLAC